MVSVPEEGGGVCEVTGGVRSTWVRKGGARDEGGCVGRIGMRTRP